MTPEQLGAQMKAKYPQYAGMDDRDVGERVMAKYPQYRKQVATGQKNWASNVPGLSQVQDVGIGIGSAVGRTVLGAGEAAARLTGFEGTAEGIRKAKEAVYVKPFETNLQTTSGKVGNVIGNIAPFFMTAPARGLTGLARAKSLIMAALKDTGISLAQTGGDVGTGATTAATSLIANRLLPGAGAGIRQRVMSGVIPGYVGDVGMGLSGQRGESREGLGAFVPGMGTAMGAGVGALQASPLILNRGERVSNKRYNTLRVVQEGNRSLDRIVRAAERTTDAQGNPKQLIDTKKFIAETDLLVGAVDDTGTVNSKEAVKNLNDVLKPWEGKVGQALEDEGKMVTLDALRDKLYKVVDDSGVIGDAKLQTKARIDRELNGLLSDFPDGDIPLRTVHDLKVQVNRTNARSFIDPEKNAIGKTLGRGLKEFVEETTDAIDTKTYNEELRKLYAVRDVLEGMDGRKVEGGRLGKHFSAVIGTMVGGQVGGPLGAIAGAEIGAKLKGWSMQRSLGGKGGKPVTISERMQNALKGGQSNKSGSLKTSQATTIAATTKAIDTNVSPNGNKSTKAKVPDIGAAKKRVQELREQIAIGQAILDEDPAKKLMRYVGKGNNTLSEINYKALGTDKKSASLDQLVTELGYKDLEEAQKAVEKYIQKRDATSGLRNELKTLKDEVRKGEDVLTYDDPKYYGQDAEMQKMVFAAVPGFGIDDEGNVTFSPERSLLAMGAVIGAQKLPRAVLIKRLRTSLSVATKDEMAEFVATVKGGGVKTNKDGTLTFASEADRKAFENGLYLVNYRPLLENFASETLGKIANLYDEVLDYRKK